MLQPFEKAFTEGILCTIWNGQSEWCEHWKKQQNNPVRSLASRLGLVLCDASHRGRGDAVVLDGLPVTRRIYRGGTSSRTHPCSWTQRQLSIKVTRSFAGCPADSWTCSCVVHAQRFNKILCIADEWKFILRHYCISEVAIRFFFGVTQHSLLEQLKFIWG